MSARAVYAFAASLAAEEHAAAGAPARRWHKILEALVHLPSNTPPAVRAQMHRAEIVAYRAAYPPDPPPARKELPAMPAEPLPAAPATPAAPVCPDCGAPVSAPGKRCGRDAYFHSRNIPNPHIKAGFGDPIVTPLPVQTAPPRPPAVAPVARPVYLCIDNCGTVVSGAERRCQPCFNAHRWGKPRNPPAPVPAATAVFIPLEPIPVAPASRFLRQLVEEFEEFRDVVEVTTSPAEGLATLRGLVDDLAKAVRRRDRAEMAEMLLMLAESAACIAEDLKLIPDARDGGA